MQNPISSVMLISILKKLCPEINSTSLEYLLLVDGGNLNRLMYGKTERGIKYASWIKHDTWLESARPKISDIPSYHEKVKTTKIAKLIDCCPHSKTILSSFDNQFILVFDAVFDHFWNNNLEDIQKRIIMCLRQMLAPESDVSYIQNATELKSISTYLVSRAVENEGKVIFGVRQIEKITSSKTVDQIEMNSSSGNDSSDLLKNRNPVEIQSCSYFELIARGLTPMEIVEQLVANDNSLYGKQYGERGNSSENWAKQLVAAPENWHFFCNGRQIIGNWSCTFLSPSEEKSVRNGLFAGEDFTLDSVNYPISAYDKESVIYLHNMSLNDGYQTNKNWISLWKSFGQRLKQLLLSGITIRSIYTCLFRQDHEKLFEQMGFKKLIKNSVNGTVYHLELTQQSITQFSWIMPDLSVESDDPTYLGQTIVFQQLSNESQLTNQELADIGSLIYDTDQYIFPPLFSRKQAKKILPYVFESDIDVMFSLNNIYCAQAVSEKGPRIVALILHKKGPLGWNPEPLLNYASLLGETLPETVNVVAEDYFKKYDDISPDTRILLNVCVHSNFRMRDELRLGSQMMKAFLQEHPHERMELYVLAETKVPMRLYLRNGFLTSEDHKCNGFSITNKSLPCYHMYRPATPTK